MAKQQLYLGQPTDTAVAVYTSSNATTSVFSATVCNSTVTADDLDVYLVPDGGAASAANQIYDALSVAANTTMGLQALINVTIPKGASLQMKAATSATLTVQISGDVS